MFRRSRTEERIKLPVKMEQSSRTETLLAILYLFAEHGKEEVSIGEVQECVFKLQKEFPLGYDFFETFLCSLDLFTDLEKLCEEGYSRRYTYSHDTLLPKNFIRLVPSGRWSAKKIIQGLSPDMIEALNRNVVSAIRNYKKRWGSWAR